MNFAGGNFPAALFAFTRRYPQLPACFFSEEITPIIRAINQQRNNIAYVLIVLEHA